MRNVRKAAGVASLASALVLAVTVMAYAQTGSTTDPNAGTTDPNATNQTNQTNQTQTSPNTSTYNTTDPNAATTDSRTINGTDDYRNDGPDLGWLGLLGLAGLFGLKRRPVTHDRDVREGRPAHA